MYFNQLIFQIDGSTTNQKYSQIGYLIFIAHLEMYEPGYIHASINMYIYI